jgi:signal transduction histidine kinase
VARLLPFRTLRGRLTLLAALTTLPAFLFVVYIAGNERADALRRAEEEARSVANVASREHASQVLGARRMLDTLARDERSDLESVLPAILAGFPQVANLWIVAADGTLEYSVVPARGPVAIRDTPVFAEALRGEEAVTGRYQVGPIVGRPVLLIARALPRAGGAPRRVLIAALELSWLDQLARQAGLPPQSAMVIADGNGRVLAGGQGSIGGFRDLVARTGRMTRARIDGIDRLAVAVPLGGTPDVWVVAGPRERDVYRIANRIFYRDIVVLALLALFAVGMSLVTTDLSVLRDLRLLEQATRRLGAGDLSARVSVPRPSGEIHALAGAFNTMADALETRQERLRSLTERLSAAREEEAARIAQELHDQLGQELTALKFEVEKLRRAGGETFAIEEGIDTAIDTVRRISSELRPGVLDRLGLVAGLEWLLREFERHSGITTDVTSDRNVEPVDAGVATALFRITQEALTNVARHAQASLVEVRLRDRGAAVELRLRDDGQGFDSNAARDRPSLGILGIEERARRLGGMARIESQPGSGTTLVVEVPRRTADAHPAG